jgi:hypothetical protein
MIDALMLTSPSRLPSESRFLFEFDVDCLHQLDMDTQHYWVATIEVALASSSPVHGLASVASIFLRGNISLQAALGVNQVICQIRDKACHCLIEQGWIYRESSITRPSAIGQQLTHTASCLQHGLRKKHKPD